MTHGGCVTVFSPENLFVLSSGKSQPRELPSQLFFAVEIFGGILYLCYLCKYSRPVCRARKSCEESPGNTGHHTS